MALKIAITSGKGGTGKTTVSVNLALQMQQLLWTQKHNIPIQLVDCDVEEPNDLLFLKEVQTLSTEIIYQSVPQIHKDKCIFCGDCEDYCNFSAISIIPSYKYAKIDKDLCHSCGACLMACQHGAIEEEDVEIGQVAFYKDAHQIHLAEGRLKVGSMMQTRVIKELKKRISDDAGVVLFDAPPGTSCAVVETISAVDYVVLVAEPTPFGLYDMQLMVALLRAVELPFGVIINKAGLGDRAIYTYLSKESITLLGEIPFSRNYASIYAKGDITSQIPEEIKASYQQIIHTLDQDFKAKTPYTLNPDQQVLTSL